MRAVLPNVLSRFLVIGVCLASAAFGQTVNFGITSAGPDNLAGVYTDPYNGVVNGTPVQAFCDDFSDEIYPPQSWSALATNLTQLPNSPSTVYYSGGTVFGSNYSETTEYLAAAMLALESLQSGDVNTRNELSFALWDIFDPTVFGTDPNNPNVCPYGCMTSAQAAGAVSYEQAALTAAANTSVGAWEHATGANVMIYSATANGTSPEAPGPGRPQEFMTVQTPEPAAAAVLGFDLLSALAGVFLLRRYRARA